MSILTILLFFLYTYGFGFSFLSLLKLKESEDFVENQIMRIGFGLCVFFIVGVILNLLKVPLYWWVFLILMAGIWYWNYQTLVKLRPMKMPKLERAMWDLIYSRCKARPHKGLAFGPPLPYHNVTSSKENGIYNKVVNFLARTTLYGGMYILVRLDIGNTYPLGYIENPDTQYVKRLFGREVAQQYDIERELLRKSIEPDEYRIENEAPEQAQAEAPAY